MFKKTIILLFPLVLAHLNAANPSLDWSSKDQIKNPESVVFNPSYNNLIVSNIDGDGTAKDGNGYLSQLSLDGKKSSIWAKGLNAPKGMSIQGSSLWVSDIDELVEVDLKTGKIKQKLKAPGAKFLNDVSSNSTTVFVSDTLGNQIFVYNGKEIKKLQTKENLESPNGLLVDNDKLIVASWGEVTDFSQKPKQLGRLFSLNLDGSQKTILTKSFGNLDGLEKSGDAYIVSDWMLGKLYKVSAKGDVELISEGKQGYADIALYNKENATFVALPQMMENTVSLLKL